MAARSIESAFKFSKMIGLKRSGLGEPESRDDGSGGFPGGCLSWRTSRVDRKVGSESDEPVGIMSSRLRTPPVVLRDRYCNALLTFPCSISLAKFHAMASSDGLGRLRR